MRLSQAEQSIFRLEFVEACIGDFEELDLGFDDEVVDNNSDDSPPLVDISREIHLEHFDDLDLTGGW